MGSMHADLTKVRQALFNLLSNASKFTDHGTITLRGQRLSDARDILNHRTQLERLDLEPHLPGLELRKL